MQLYRDNQFSKSVPLHKNEFFRYEFDQIRSFLQIWSHLLKISLMENFIFCAVALKLTASII